jgi:hypothetical protein
MDRGPRSPSTLPLPTTKQNRNLCFHTLPPPAPLALQSPLTCPNMAVGPVVLGYHNRIPSVNSLMEAC